MSVQLFFRRGHVIACIAIVFLVGTGCTSKYGPQMTTVNHYPQCYKPIAELRQDEKTTTNSTAAGAGMGALLGALVGGLATGKVEGALIGAAAGGATGAVAGHAYGKNQQQKTDQQKLHAYLSQLDGESSSMDRATAAAKVATKCYDQQFQQAAANFKSGQLTRQDFSNRYTEIRSGLEETARILNNTATTMAQKDSQYQQVLAADQQEAGAQYQNASTPPDSKPQASKAKRKPAATASKPTMVATPVAQQTQKWNSSREDLEETKQEVEQRRRSYDDTVNVLLGEAGPSV